MRIVPLLVLLASSLFAARPLEMIFVDVEGGQATVVKAPSGESMVIDAGWSGRNARDAERIVAAAKKLGIKRIDYLVVTHYHEDHVGGVPQLADRIPIVTYVDHGPSVESGKRPDELMKAYLSYREKGRHLEVKPGDTIPLKGMTVEVISSAGKLIEKPMPGAGAANPACAGVERRPPDKTENAQSVGLLFTLGKFRLLNLADVTWNHEIDLMCPATRVAPVDVYLVSHHGMNMSGSAAFVHPLQRAWRDHEQRGAQGRDGGSVAGDPQGARHGRFLAAPLLDPRRQG